MVKQSEFDKWLADEDLDTIQIENGVKFGSENPWDKPENSDSTGTICLVDGIINVNWVEGGFNGHGEEQFDNINEFAERFADVMENGLG